MAFCEPASIVNTSLEPVLHFNVHSQTLQILLEITSTPDSIPRLTYHLQIHYGSCMPYRNLSAGEAPFGESYDALNPVLPACPCAPLHEFLPYFKTRSDL